jgi:fatty-acyl-CoA synthase
MERHFATVWESVADAVGDETTLVQGGTRRSWTELDDRAARLAGAFVEAGLGPGSKVAQYLYNAPEFVESSFAALKLRAIPVNVNYRYLDDELLYLLDNSEAEVLVFHASLGERVARVAERTHRLKLLVEVDDVGRGGPSVAAAQAYEAVVAGHDPMARITRDPADILMTYTGGTTGLPKGVMSAIGPAVDSVLTAAPPLLGEAPLTDPADVAPAARRFASEGRRIVSLPACPLMHATGMAIGTIPGVTFGGTIVLMTNRGLDADEVWSAVERERVLTMTLVGDAFSRPLLRGLVDSPGRDLDSLRVICSAGAMFSTEVKQGLLDRLPNALIIDFIAATEGAMGMSIASRDHPAVTGRFTPAAGVKVFDADDVEVTAGSGESGFVAVPDAVQLGYFHDQEKTDRTFRSIGGVRYSIPGDWAMVEADGSLTLLGRGSQCINTGGEKVFPEEVEEAVKRHPSVEDCLVFGVPDERFGQRVVAVMSLAPGLAVVTGAEVVDSLRNELSSYKLPREVRVVATVPRAPNGKADYPAARKLFSVEAPAQP